MNRTAKQQDFELTGPEKAAILLISMGVETASGVLRYLTDSEVEQISLEIARMRNVPANIVEQVLREFNHLTMARQYVAQGGLRIARELLMQTLGPERAEEVLSRIEATIEVSAFHLLQTVETSQLINFIQNEHPQTAALILAHLKPKKAADIIAELPPDMQTEIMYRLATMGKTSPELLRDIEEVIRQQMGAVFGTTLSTSGGIDTVVSILNAVNKTTERNILEALQERDVELAAQIKSKMFVFDDLINLTDRDLQVVLTEVDQNDLVLALKAASPELKEKILRNVSERAAAIIEEELELLGPVRVSDVEQAQQRILEVVQRLEEQEEITISRGNEDLIV